MESLATVLAGDEGTVEVRHHDLRGLVVDAPQAHQQGAGTGFLESALQTEDAVLLQFAQTCLACRQDGQRESAEVELGNLAGREHTVFQPARPSSTLLAPDMSRPE